jgi:hypothetical protein
MVKYGQGPYEVAIGTCHAHGGDALDAMDWSVTEIRRVGKEDGRIVCFVCGEPAKFYLLALEGEPGP